MAFQAFMSDEVLHYAEISDREWCYQSDLEEGETEFRIIGNIHMGWELWQKDEEGKTSAPMIYRHNEKSKAIRASDGSDRLHPFFVFPAFLTDKKTVKPLKINSKDIFRQMRKIQSDNLPKQIYATALCCIKKTKAAGGQTPWKYEFCVVETRDSRGNKQPVERMLTAEEESIILQHPLHVESIFTGESPYL